MHTEDHAESEHAAFLARQEAAYQRRVAEKVSAGLTRERAEELAGLELSCEGDRSLPAGLVDVSDK